MIIINDFFVRHIEAVSNQMEYVKCATNGIIISAKRFMGQRALQPDDIKDNILVLSPILYRIILPFVVLFSRTNSVHLFEEQPSPLKRLLLNMTSKKVYISMYRTPSDKYAHYLNKYKSLVRVFVELQEHKDLLVKKGMPNSSVVISPTPAKIPREEKYKEYNPEKSSFLFASWNNGEGDQTENRGLTYLLDLLVKNPGFTLTVMPRDNKTHIFEKQVQERRLKGRVHIQYISNDGELETAFDNCDFVAFPIRKKLTKDVPNSLIDGLSRGKPVLISDILGFSNTVLSEKIGIVIHHSDSAKKMTIKRPGYMTLSNNAFKLSRNYTKESYIDAILNGYEGYK